MPDLLANFYTDFLVNLSSTSILCLVAALARWVTEFGKDVGATGLSQCFLNAGAGSSQFVRVAARVER